MKADVKVMTDNVMEKLEKLEGQMLDMESKTAAVAKEVKVVKGKTTRLEHNLNDHELRMRKLEKEMNDAEQYSRRWNLRVYKVPEVKGAETADDCAKKVAGIFSNQVGVPITRVDIEVAHRAGKPGDKPRPILVRFFDRKKRDEVLANRKKLKGKGIAIDEDLTWQNYQLSKRASQSSATMSVWSSGGKILAKLKNNVTVRLSIHSNLDDVFRKAMGVDDSASADDSVLDQDK